MKDQRVTKLGQKEFSKEVESYDGIVLVNFWAPWCGPCRAIDPVVEEIAKEYEGKVKVAKVNIDENNELAMQFAINFIPTFLVFIRGAVKESIVGQVPKHKLLEAIKRVI